MTHIHSAFQYLIPLTQVNLPNGLTWIGGSAFRDCSNLEHILIDSDDEAEVQRITALLPEDLQGKVIPKAIYGPVHEAAKAHMAQALTLTNPLSFWRDNSRQDVLLRLRLSDALVNVLDEEKRPNYAKAREEMLKLPLSHTEAAVEGFRH